MAVIDVTNPSTGLVIGTIPSGDAPAADTAVTTARKAQQRWSRRAPAERGELLREAAVRLRANADELAELQHLEGGKPLADSMGGLLAGISAIEQYAELGPTHRGRSLQGEWNAMDAMINEPRGVVVILVPWNDPLAIALGASAAALVTGNTVVLKPSEKTPFSTSRAVEMMSLPDDVFTVALGDARIGRPLVVHPDVDVVMHIGSVHTGREIAAARAPIGGKTILELGGKDAMIVDEDVDPRWAAEQAALGAFANAGQICTSVERIYVHREVADAFTTSLAEIAQDYRIGPMIDAAQRDLVHRHIDAAVGAGAVVHVGGVIPSGPGFHYPPTVVSDVSDDMEIMREETFGPVAPISVVQSFDEALDAANRSDYGLAATVLTGDQSHAQQAWRTLEVGTVKINAVFGGAPGGSAHPRRGSGLGFGYGPELLDEMTATKVVHYQPTPRQELPR